MKNIIHEYVTALTDRAEQAGDDKLAYAVDQFSKLLHSCGLPRELFAYMKSYMAQGEEVATTEDYWDCECESRYIHRKADRLTCPVCGSEEADSPDARVQELLELNLFQPPCPVPPCPESVPYDNHLVDCNCD